MAEHKAKPAAKKVTTAKSGSAAAGKPKAATTTLQTAAKKSLVKKPAAKKAAIAEPKKAKAPAVKKPPEKKIPEKKTPAIRVKPATPDKTVTRPTPEERYRMVETAAYFIAEQHGFQGRSDEHWAAAERQIAAKLGQ